MSLSNKSLLPPFVPFGRNEDGIFASMLALCEPTTLFGHISYAVLHDSHRPSAYDHGILSASQTRLADLLVPLLSSAAAGAPAAASETRLQHLGAVLSWLGSMKRVAFRSLLADIVLSQRCDALLMEDMRCSKGYCSSHWKHAIEDYRQTFVTAATRPDFILPIEFRDGSSLQDGLDAVQSFLARFGDFVHIWPILWDYAARTLKHEMCSYP
jgi:hypothetical protein